MLAPAPTLPEPIACPPPSGAGLAIRPGSRKRWLSKTRRTYYARFFLDNIPPASDNNVPISSIDAGSGVTVLLTMPVSVAL